ncbi:unnamed protein product [Candidula unifasciata]|uniref:SCP domain-containing protein n=1 Tax=Candidula unifasciata TaxID=100452 RepID=A0A8S3Z254_9EUPU|nr:unnamed protein product [Candidula unifasciata]
MAQASKAGTPGAQTPNIENFRQEVLVAHNKRREWHQAPPVKLSPELNKLAQEWAENLAKQNKFEHSPADRRKGIGENLAAHTRVLSGDEVVEMWYSEIQNYNFQKPGFAMNTSHFTQLVWKDCQSIGVGMSTQKAGNGMYMYVANYQPAGNVINYFDKNVLTKK